MLVLVFVMNVRFAFKSARLSAAAAKQVFALRYSVFLFDQLVIAITELSFGCSLNLTTETPDLGARS